MSNKALNWTREMPLKPGEKTILLLLANSINDDTGYCFPSIKTLASWCGRSQRSVMRYLKNLIENNIVKKKYKHNDRGYRIGTEYSINYDVKIDQISSKILSDNLASRINNEQSLSDNLASRNPSLSDNCASLGDKNDKPKCQTRHPTTYKPNINQKRNNAFSLVDNFNEQKQQAVIGVKFEQLRKVYDDSYDIENARREHKKVCLENDHPVQMADNLIKARKSQIIYFKEQTKLGKLMPTPSSLTNWLKGERWNDIIKPLGEKKKVSPYVKCKCGEEYLRGSYCGRCEELKKPRLVYA